MEIEMQLQEHIQEQVQVQLPTVADAGGKGVELGTRLRADWRYDQQRKNVAALK